VRLSCLFESSPARIQIQGQEWLVPVIRGLNFESEREAEAYLLADNQLTISAGFDEKLLAEILPDHQMNVTGLGFSEEELAKYIPQFRTIQLEQADSIPETPPEGVTRTGDIWLCGNHKILCGDSRELLVDVPTESQDTILTDPPYGADLLIGRQQLGHRTVANDNSLDWMPAIATNCFRILKQNANC